MVQPVALSHKKPFKTARRVHIDAMAPADVEHLFGGAEPLIVEGLDAAWPEELRAGRLDAFLDPKQKLRSVFVEGKQVFGVTAREFLDGLAAAKNVRVFSINLAKRVTDACTQPAWLFDKKSERGFARYYSDVPGVFIGSGGAITPLHYDFELNYNWHIGLAGERTVYLWTDDESHNLFKLPAVGLSLIPFSLGLLSYRHGQGYEVKLKAGELLYMPPKCWHQIEYGIPSIAMTYGVHNSEEERATGVEKGKFWKGMMCYFLAVGRLKRSAVLSLPLMAPYGAFCPVYMIGGYVAKRLPERVGAPILRRLYAVDEYLYQRYLPLMKRFFDRYWTGY
jgi:hypothetical protein